MVCRQWRSPEANVKHGKTWFFQSAETPPFLAPHFCDFCVPLPGANINDLDQLLWGPGLQCSQQNSIWMYIVAGIGCMLKDCCGLKSYKTLTSCSLSLDPFFFNLIHDPTLRLLRNYDSSFSFGSFSRVCDLLIEVLVHASNSTGHAVWKAIDFWSCASHHWCCIALRSGICTSFQLLGDDFIWCDDGHNATPT